MAMKKTFWSSAEVIDIFKVEQAFISELVAEEIVCPTCGSDSSDFGFSVDELEKLRLAKVLIEEMDVNLPGVEVVLRMRQNMIDMRRQFDAILEELTGQLRRSAG
jgi:MerR family transcriptional regulator, heat shock protein HspR